VVIGEIVAIAVQRKASDIHLVVGLPPIIRVNGELLHVNEEVLFDIDTIGYAKEILSEKNFRKFAEVGECDTSYQCGNVNFRVNVFKQRTSTSIVMRLIPSVVPTIDDLHLPAIFKKLSMKRSGLILVTGPTGSGKTTTMAAMVDYMSKYRNENIITIEDPIEYVFKHGNGIINQRQVGEDTGDFSTALRSALREDPDVIIVGEMRDLETISAALTAAETGHLVISTLHTIGSAKTIDRIIDVFPSEQQPQIRSQLSTSLEAVISQQLISNYLHDGRSLALEIMLGTHSISNLIREGKTEQINNAIQLSKGEGMITMDHSLVNLYLTGRISRESLFKYCIDEKDVKRKIGEL